MHIVVTGYGRSGTSLLYVMLAGTVKGYRFFDTEVDALKALDDTAKITKRPLDLFAAKEIERTIPDVRWVVVIRDIRSVLCSNAMWTEAHALSWDTARTDTGYPTPGLVARDRAIDRLRDPIIVRFEDLMEDPDGEQGKLRRALGLEMEGRFSDSECWQVSDVFYALMNGKTRLDKSRIAPWKWQWERVVEQFEEAPELFDILIKRGYEKDRSWYGNRVEMPQQLKRQKEYY